MLLFVVFLARFLNPAFCPNEEDYFPCKCILEEKSTSAGLYCTNVSIIEQVGEMLKSKPTAIFEFTFLELQPSHSFLPENIFGNRHIINGPLELGGHRKYAVEQVHC